jgi:hypothetical protein
MHYQMFIVRLARVVAVLASASVVTLHGAQAQSTSPWTEVYRSGIGTSNELVQAVDLDSVGRAGDHLTYRARNTMFGRDTEATYVVNCSANTRGSRPTDMYATYPNTLAGEELKAVCSFTKRQDDEKMGRYKQLYAERNGGALPVEADESEQMRLYRKLSAERADRDATSEREAWLRGRERAVAAAVEQERSESRSSPAGDPGPFNYVPPRATNPSGPACGPARGGASAGGLCAGRLRHVRAGEPADECAQVPELRHSRPCRRSGLLEQCV